MLGLLLRTKIADVIYDTTRSGDFVTDCFALIRLYQPLGVFPIYRFEDLVRECIGEDYDPDRITEQEKQLYKDVFYSICEAYGVDRPYMKDEPKEAEWFKMLLRFTFGRGESILKEIKDYQK